MVVGRHATELQVNHGHGLYGVEPKALLQSVRRHLGTLCVKKDVEQFVRLFEGLNQRIKDRESLTRMVQFLTHTGVMPTSAGGYQRNVRIRCQYGTA